MVIVTALSCLERGLGFAYRIFLSRTIGSEGLGLYQIALSLIGVLITLSASGIPITVSRLIIKSRAIGGVSGENKAVSAGILTSLIISLPITAFFFVFKNSLSSIFADPRCNTLFLIILPGVSITSIYAVIRGFLWGNKSFYTYSILELLEEIVMIACGVFLILKGETIFQKSIYASVAVLISYIFSFITSSALFVAKGGKFINPREQLKPLISSSITITFMRAISSFSSSLIALILPAILIATGLDRQTAISQFGVISGMAMPLLFIPSTLIGSFSLVLAPELSESFYKKNTDKIKAGVEKSLLYSLLISILVIPAFAGTGEYVGRLIYNNSLAGVYVRNSAFVMIPMSITIISTSLLNSMGFERKTLLYFLIGSAFLLISIITLPFLIGNYSLIIGYLLSFSITAVLNVLLLKRVCCNKLDFVKKCYIVIPVCLFFCFLNYFSFSILTSFISEFFAMAISSILTLICLCISLVALKIISLEDLKR